MACILFHNWDSCKCRKCGAVRDLNHKWSGCKCQICGKENHEYIDCKCRKCAIDVSLCYGKFYEYREIKDCTNCSLKQLCMDQYKSRFAELEKKETEDRIKYKGMHEELERRKKWEFAEGQRIAEERRQKERHDSVSPMYSIDEALMKTREDTCNKAINYMKKFKYYDNVPGGPPHSVKNELYDFIKCIDEMSETAIKKKNQGILIPKEIQIIRAIYEMHFVYAEIMIASKQALEKFGGYF